jgi:TIR domain
MVQYRGPGAEKVYAAARRVVDAGLRTDGSVFTPGAAIWTLERAEDLYRRFVQQPDTSSASFEQKLRRQLQGAPPATFQAMGELLFLHLLIASDIGGASKRSTIQAVLSWSPEPVTIPADLAAVLDNGLAKTGVAFKTYRPFQLWYLVEFLRAWKRLDTAARSRLLEDPWAFKEFAFSVPIKSAYTQREAFLHLVHPATFERIVSRDHKRRIVEHLRDPADDEPDVDRALATIRASLEEELGEGFDFYQPPVDARWQPPPVEPGEAGGPTTGRTAPSEIENKRKNQRSDRTLQAGPRIFLSYRRDDTRWLAGRLYDRLRERYGRAGVFQDIDTIRPGVKYTEYIESAISECKLVIVIIGDSWLSATDASGRRRLDAPRDMVRLEVAAALRRNIPIIPVLVQGAPMPSEEELPVSIADLTLYNASEITATRWEYDVAQLLQGIDDRLRLVSRSCGTRGASKRCTRVSLSTLKRSLMSSSRTQAGGYRLTTWHQLSALRKVEFAAFSPATPDAWGYYSMARSDGLWTIGSWTVEPTGCSLRRTHKP